MNEIFLINFFKFIPKIERNNNINDEGGVDSSNLESSECEEKNKSILLDTSSNRINSVNTYTFNTKFCNFNNNKEGNKKKLF